MPTAQLKNQSSDLHRAAEQAHLNELRLAAYKKRKSDQRKATMLRAVDQSFGAFENIYILVILVLGVASLAWGGMALALAKLFVVSDL